MKLENKLIRNITRTIVRFPLVLLVSASIVMPLSCSPTPPKNDTPSQVTNGENETPDSPVIINEAPDTQITRTFDDDGTVTYTLSGTDDDSVDYISVRINDGDWEDFYDDNISVSAPIIKGNNTIEARAYDDEGQKDETPAMGFFVSPTEEEARKLMEEIIEELGGYYALQEDALLSLGADKSFYVDYLIKRKDKQDVVVNYVGHEDDLEEELNNRRVLDMYEIPNLYFVRIPETEINSKLRDFIDNGYKQNDE